MKQDNELTIESLKDALPVGMGSRVTQNVFEAIKNMNSDVSDYQGYMEENLFRYSALLKDITGPQKNDPMAYACAVKFCTLIAAGHPRKAAWKSTFPDRAEALMKKNGLKNIDPIISGYVNTELVSAIQSKMFLAAHIQYAPLREKAMGSLYDLMNGKAAETKVIVYEKDDEGNLIKDRYGRKVPMVDEFGNTVYETYRQAVSPNVQMLSAKAILEETRVPEDKSFKLELSITDDEVQATKDMANALREVALSQRNKVAMGSTVEEVQQIGHVIDVNIEEYNKDE